ncbi:Cleft lip and palate transmembrane protein 1 [Psilocybe cubensis]|uniref:Cleft lip and palate transmembrane protein 1 n=1 Tax=Psilocybe cubensis TaxID=181762 RepID=A0ACB8H3I3_PSICU|nr:Cleft lip and palate transmembrane protein 1 [Psilocybe cubensis]KAH9482353.1 Cleft lip and palate transmembrane protein 1 [Psilocybe cubensis]
MPEPAPRTAQDEREETGFQTIIRIGQATTKFLSSNPANTPPTAPTVVDSNGQHIPPTTPVDPSSLPPTTITPYWPLGLSLDMHVYFSTSSTPDVFSKWTSEHRTDKDHNLPHFVWNNITYGDYNDHRVIDFDVKFPESVLRNGSLWADIVLTRDGASIDPRSPKFDPERVHHVRKLLTPYLPRQKVRKEKNLLSSDDNIEVEVEEPDVIAPHWHQNITLALISDAAEVPFGKLPPPVAEHIHLIPDKRDSTGTKAFYRPIIFPNEFWHLRSHYVQINETTPSLPVRITYQPMSYMKFQIFASMTHGFNEAAKQQGQASGAELDEVKRMLLETNPWFLALTGLVSLLHVVFEMLAFKSDVTHWRAKKEMVGVSVRLVQIVTNVFVQLVILLYLIDNNENTSWMILMGSGMGVIIEAWKITKAVDIKVIPSTAGSLLPYKLEITDKHVLSEDEKKTQEYDRLAFRYVSYVAIPLLAGYTVYSLVYESHRGWYSFVISTLTSFVYMFGFAQLIPQLIINYKLKSVAHMPMKAMVLHQDAIPASFGLFPPLTDHTQRWIYRIDPNRVNEYGQVLAADVAAVDGEEMESKKNK